MSHVRRRSISITHMLELKELKPVLEKKIQQLLILLYEHEYSAQDQRALLTAIRNLKDKLKKTENEIDEQEARQFGRGFFSSSARVAPARQRRRSITQIRLKELKDSVPLLENKIELLMKPLLKHTLSAHDTNALVKAIRGLSVKLSHAKKIINQYNDMRFQ